HSRRPSVPGGAGDGVRSPRLCCAGAGRIGGPRPDRGGPRLSPRPGVRANGSQAGEPRRAHRTANMSERLTLALPKGRLLDGSLGLLRDIGVDGIDADSRRLLFTDPARGLRLLLLQPADG